MFVEMFVETLLTSRCALASFFPPPHTGEERAERLAGEVRGGDVVLQPLSGRLQQAR